MASPVAKPDLPTSYVTLISTSVSPRACLLPSVRLGAEQELPWAQLHAPVLVRLHARAEPWARTRELLSAQTHAL